MIYLQYVYTEIFKFLNGIKFFLSILSQDQPFWNKNCGRCKKVPQPSNTITVCSLYLMIRYSWNAQFWWPEQFVSSFGGWKLFRKYAHFTSTPFCPDFILLLVKKTPFVITHYLLTVQNAIMFSLFCIIKLFVVIMCYIL